MPVSPASAATGTVLGIKITEVAARTDTYDPVSNGGIPVTTVNGATGVVNISNNLGKDLSDVTVVLSEGGNTNAWAKSSDAGSIATTAFNMADSGTQITVHIPLLPAGKYALLTYTVATTKMPVYLTTSYSANKIPAVTGQKTSVTLNLVKDASSPILNTNINTLAVSVAPAAGWTLSNNATTDGSTALSGSNMVWTPATPLSVGSATFDATISDPTPFNNTSSLALYPLANSTLIYKINSASQSAIGNVSVVGAPTATTGDVSVDVTKQLLGTGNDRYWQFTPKIGFVSSPQAPGVTYTLSAVSVWITDGSVSAVPANHQLSDTTGTIGVTSAPLPASLTTSQAWVGTTTNVHTIAGSDTPPGNIYGFTAGVPVGFVKPTISIANDGTQIGIQYNNDANTVTFQKSIWILNDYYVEATKTITSLGGNQYKVTISVKNLGTKKSPDVYVYDIVPSSFSGPSTIKFFDKSGTEITLPSLRFPNIDTTNKYTGRQAAVSIAGINGAAYWWNVGNLDQSGGAQDAMSLAYQVDGGSGDYPLSELYMVGLDPALTTNLQSTPFLNNAVSMANANFETLAALGAAGLLVIGMFGTARRRF